MMIGFKSHWLNSLKWALVAPLNGDEQPLIFKIKRRFQNPQ